MLADLRKSNTKTAKVILGAAVIDDILGMIVLAIVSAVAGDTGTGIVDIAIVVAEALIFVAVALYVGPRVVGRIAGERPLMAGKRAYDRRLDLLKPVETREAALVLALGACLGLAALSAYLQLAPIIGAFLAGVAVVLLITAVELDQLLALVVEMVGVGGELLGEGAAQLPALFLDELDRRAFRRGGVGGHRFQVSVRPRRKLTISN